MNTYHRAGYAAGIASLLAPFAVPFAVAPTPLAATALFAEGATRPSGEAQSGFAGAFCEQNTCQSLGNGSITASGSARRTQEAVDATPGEIIVAGYSVGAAGIYNRLRTWEEDPTLAPDPQRVVLVLTFGNPENKFGGDNRRVPGTGLPESQPYQHLDVVAQYDSVADSPTRFGFYSAVNSAFSSRHFAYFDGLDVNDPDNLVYQDGNTTYMLIPAETLPMVSWLSPFVSDERLAQLDAKYRPLVERDYDRPAYIPQGEGADWGNGTAPPSVQEPESAQLSVTAARQTQTSPAAVSLAAAQSEPAPSDEPELTSPGATGGDAGSEPADAAVPLEGIGADTEVDVADTETDGTDPDEQAAERDLEAQVDESADTASSDRSDNDTDDTVGESARDTESGSESSGSDMTGTDKVGSDKVGSDKTGSDTTGDTSSKKAGED